MNYVKLFKRYAKIRFLELIEYRLSFALGVMASLTFLAMNFFFWGSIFSHTAQINGWTFGQIILLQGYFHLFMGIFWVFFHFSEHMDELIIHGELDKLLARPVNVLVAYMFQMFDWFALMELAQIIVYMYIAIKLGVSVSLINFLGSIVIITLGTVIFTLLLLSLSNLSFWIGKTEAVMTFWNNIWNIGGYPVTIFPIQIQLILTFGIPLIFLQTYPTLLITNQISLDFFIQTIIYELVLILFWFLIALFIWRKGLKRYDSYGG